MVFLAVGFIFLATFFLITAIMGKILKTDTAVVDRMERYTTVVAREINADNYWNSNQPENSESPPVKPFRAILAKYGKLIEAKEYTKLIERELQKGDIPLRGYEFIFIIFALTIGLSLMAFLWNRQWISAVVAGLFGITAPVIYLRLKQHQKVTKFNHQIGDALVMVSSSLKAGYGFMQAIDMVAKEMAPPIQNEFARVIQEINLGFTTEDALIRLTERVPSPDLDLVVTAMLIQRQIGGNLSEILDNISQTIRERIRIKGEVKALTAQGKLSGLIIGLLPIGIGAFLLLINPTYVMQLFTDPRGRFLLGYAAVAELIALVIIRKIINIKV